MSEVSERHELDSEFRLACALAAGNRKEMCVRTERAECALSMPIEVTAEEKRCRTG